MAIEVREKVIGGQRYEVTMLPGRVGTALGVRLVKLLGPGVGSFLGGAGRAAQVGGDVGAEVALALGGSDAIHELCERLNDKDFVALCTDLAKYSRVEVGADELPQLSEIFDDHFAGRYDLLLAWLRFALEVNYARFFDGKGATAVQNLIRALSAFRSRTASTGQSTASPRPDATPTA